MASNTENVSIWWRHHVSDFTSMTVIQAAKPNHSIQCVPDLVVICVFASGWRHQKETFSALLALCAGNPPVTGEFPAQRPVTRSFDVFFDLRPNERLSKQSWGWWFEAQLRPLWRRSNDYGALLSWISSGMKCLTNCGHFLQTPFC